MSEEYLIICKSSTVLKRYIYKGMSKTETINQSLKVIYKWFNIQFIVIYPITVDVCVLADLVP